ncbi:sensor histidine kinase [Geomobilimonas luticola]|nr:ATP-binding protein [Geomobilimonas luticola]
MTEQKGPHTSRITTDSSHASLWKIFISVIAIVLFAEATIMLVLQLFFSSRAPAERAFIDVFFLTVILVPTLYFFVTKPLLGEMLESLRAEQELSAAYLQLQERKTFVESVLTNMQSGILVTDPECQIKLANPYVLDFFKSSLEDMIGRNLADIAPALCDAVRTGRDTGEVPLHYDISDIIVGFRRFDLKSPDRAVTGHIVSFIDLTEIISIRRDLRIKERLATMGEVVARVAHEIRNPLFGMTAVGQILSKELALTPPQKELMDSLLKEAGRLNRMVDDLLFCSREPKLNRQLFPLKQMIEETLLINAPFAADRGVTMRSDLTEQRVMVDGDQEKIEQVLLNVLKNAIEATPGGGSVDVTLVADRKGTQIMVSDSGTGIPDDIMEKLFDVFFTTKKHGAGLGLSISRTIIESHNGTLTAHNNPDGGATFVIALPQQGRVA